MRVVPIDKLRDVLEEFGGSARLSRDVIYLSAQGLRIRFAGKGLKIGFNHINRLENLGLDYVYLQDPLCQEDLELLVDEDTRVAVRTMLEDLMTRCEVVLEVFLEEKGKDAILDYTFREYWQKYCNLSIGLLQRYRKTLQDLSYIIRANYSHKRVSPLPNVYTERNFRINYRINTALITGILAMHYGEFNAERIFHIVSGALLSDIGFVDRAWSLKTPRSEEFFFRHPRIGCMVVNETHGLSTQMGIVALEHHRYLNNTGYPDDLPEKDFYGYPRQMHLYSKIVSVAENFESLRCIYNPVKVLMAMKRLSGRLFDEKAVDLLEKYVGLYYIGERVRLTSGEVGIVLSLGKKEEMRVLIVEDEEGKRLGTGREVLIEDFGKEVQSVAVDIDDNLKSKILRLISAELLEVLEQDLDSV